MNLNVALIGYGAAAKIFHASLIAGVSGLSLAVICSSRADAVRQDWPQVLVLATPQEAFDRTDIDLVVIATPNDSHYPLALAALLAGKHVVVDKPCTVTLVQTEHLLQVAQQQGRVLTVFQNRRLDSDFLALQQVLASGVLGRVVEVNAHFDRYRPSVPGRWREQNVPGAGLWLDLGAHLVDQALQLWGLPDALSVELAEVRDEALVNDWFHAVLRYASKDEDRRVILHASTLVAEQGPRWAVHGTHGSFIKFGLDAQEDALKAGERPYGDNVHTWGIDPALGQLTYWMPMPGVSAPVCRRQTAPNPPGNYLDYYANVRDHLRGQTALMVTPTQVLQVMQVLSAGQESARQGRWIRKAEFSA